jgi:peptidoglycan hydrolase-like protein with peptidoglycan-binding domain
MRRTLILVPVLALAGAAVAVGTGLPGRRTSPTSAAPPAPPAVATVERRTLSRTETVDGTLGYGDLAGVQPAPGTGGMVTWLPDEGDVIARGGTVYRVDQRGVPLLYGAIPFYRRLSAGRRGADVRQLERNLDVLGYPVGTVDGRYTGATARAVRKWQRDQGRPATGVVQPGDAVVSAGARRVAEITGAPGVAAAGILLRWTGTTRVVEVDLDAGYADLARRGTPATVTLPDGSRVAARVTGIGTPTSKAKGDGATLPVELTVTRQQRLGAYQAARVRVGLAADTRADVLAVPVTALVARPGGGYAVTTGSAALPVRTGVFADGFVEVSGPGVVAGLAVGVPR